MRTKLFNEIIETMKLGLRSLQMKQEEAKTFQRREELRHEIEKQEIRIEFIQKGYTFRIQEQLSQQKLYERQTS